MANQIPLSGATDAAGGVLLPDAQGQILAEAVQRQAGALSLAADSRVTGSRREVFPIWKGRPEAEFVGEGGTKPVTGAEFGAGTLNIKKIATIIAFTDEQLEDVQGGDLNVLVDSDIRGAIADKADADAVDGSQFDSHLGDTVQVVNWDDGAQDALALAVSAAMGSLEANGYTDFGVLLPGDAARHLRDARVTGIGGGGTVPQQAPTSQALYVPNTDPLYGLPRAFSTNVDRISEGGTIGYVVSRPNLHVRIRRDVVVTPSRQATLKVNGEELNLYQNDLTALRYVTRLGFFVHDIDRAVVKIVKE